jgi:predicted GIY-YIG superfamily endonuclease
MSKNPESRLAAHNSGHGSKMAVDQHGFNLKYVSKPFDSKSKARFRELQIKKWSRLKKEKLIKGEWI